MFSIDLCYENASDPYVNLIVFETRISDHPVCIYICVWYTICPAETPVEPFFVYNMYSYDMCYIRLPQSLIGCIRRVVCSRVKGFLDRNQVPNCVITLRTPCRHPVLRAARTGRIYEYNECHPSSQLCVYNENSETCMYNEIIFGIHGSIFFFFFITKK